MISTALMLAWMPGPLELVVIAGFALIIFGRRLPEVARSMGKSIVEFKKGLKGVEDEIDEAGKGRTPKALPPDSPHEDDGAKPAH